MCRITSLNADVNKVTRECSGLQASLSEAESRLAAQQREQETTVAEWKGKVRSLEEGKREVQFLKKEAEEAREKGACLRHEMGVLEQKVQAHRLELQQKDNDNVALTNKIKVCKGCG